MIGRKYGPCGKKAPLRSKMRSPHHKSKSRVCNWAPFQSEPHFQHRLAAEPKQPANDQPPLFHNFFVSLMKICVNFASPFLQNNARFPLVVNRFFCTDANKIDARRNSLVPPSSLVLRASLQKCSQANEDDSFPPAKSSLDPLHVFLFITIVGWGKNTLLETMLSRKEIMREAFGDQVPTILESDVVGANKYWGGGEI